MMNGIFGVGSIVGLVEAPCGREWAIGEWTKAARGIEVGPEEKAFVGIVVIAGVVPWYGADKENSSVCIAF